jgi:hypothetical protein
VISSVRVFPLLVLLVVMVAIAGMATTAPAQAARPADSGEAQAIRTISHQWLRAHLKPALVKKTRLIRISVSSANH